MRRGWSIAWLVIGLGACNAIAGLDGDFTTADAGGATSSEAGGGGSSGAGSSTSSSSTSGASTSSSSSSGTVDAGDGGGDAIDGGQDAGDGGGDAGPLTFCQTTNAARPGTLKFCWDFTGADVAPAWGWSASRQVPAAGTLLAVEGPVGAASRGLHVQNLSASAGTSPGVALFWDLTNVTEIPDNKAIRLEFDFKVDGGASYALIGGFQVGPASARIEYGLAFDGSICSTDKLCASENDRGDKPAAGSVGVTRNAPRHGQVTLTRSNNTIGGRVDLGGTNVFLRTSNAIPDGTFGPIRVVLGAAFAGNVGPGLDLQLDNVTVDLITP